MLSMDKENKQDSVIGLYHLSNLSGPERIQYRDSQVRCLDSETANQLWESIKVAIQQIQRKEHSALNFEELYRHVYYLVLHRYGHVLYEKVREVISEHVIIKVRSKVLANLDHNFLRVINRSWDHHQTSLSMIKDILMYMDKVLVRHSGVSDVYTLGLNMFKELVIHYEVIQAYLQETLLGLVSREREGHVMDRQAFKRATRMLMMLGINTPTVYQLIFEVPFLQQSTIFYKAEGFKLLEKHNASTYLRKVEIRINEEVERSEECYDETTTPKIIKVLEDELIKTNMKAVLDMENSGIVYMMNNRQTEDLNCMYNMLGRVSDGHKTMFECISLYLRNQGQSLVMDDATNSNAIVYVQNLIDLKENIDYYLLNSFQNDRNFKQMIASDFENILNFNSKSPEYLSLFIDDKLKRAVKGMNDDDKKLVLDKTVVLFKFLQNKDTFEQYYKQHLAKRLLFNKAINEDNEMAVLMKFKAECGLQYTRKMEGMFKDIWTSSYITEEFKKHVSDTGNTTDGVDLKMKVLTTVYWPTNNIPPPCNLPTPAFTAFEIFKMFYRNCGMFDRHRGRVLTLLPQLGTAELEACFVKSRHHNGEPLRSYTLQVSTYQMCVLMLFNERSSWSLQEMERETSITRKDLVRSLQSLMAGKSSQGILTKHPENGRVNHNDIFVINTSFTSKTNKVKISQFPVKFETDSEEQDPIKRMDEERIYETEAAIVRIMKARRQMNHDALVNEVINILSPRFVPTKQAVKTRIEILIEREYIERSVSDRLLYNYVV